MGICGPGAAGRRDQRDAPGPTCSVAAPPFKPARITQSGSLGAAGAHAATETSSSSATDQASPPDYLAAIPPDSVLDILDANGSVLETDDDGSMAKNASSIAGFTVPGSRV